MINISKLYLGLAGPSDHLRYTPDASAGPVVAYNCTRMCNLRCRHCYSSSGCDRAADELSTEQAKDLLRQLKDAFCPVVLFSGGEPLLREDLFDLLAECQRMGLRAVISTNGTLIGKDAAMRMADLGVAYVGVSVDGPAAFHDSFRRVDGGFQRAVAGIRRCRQADLRTGLRFTITRQNARHVGFVFDLALAEGMRRICFYHLVRSGRAESEAVPTSAQTRSALDTILDLTEANADRLDEVLTVGNHADGPYSLVCMQRKGRSGLDRAKALLMAAGGNKVGERIACIGWQGDVYADQFWRDYCLGSILRTHFQRIWRSDEDTVLLRLRHKSEYADPRCKRCQWFALCKGNYRFLGPDPSDSNWLNEPACYLTDGEIARPSQVQA